MTGGSRLDTLRAGSAHAPDRRGQAASGGGMAAQPDECHGHGAGAALDRPGRRRGCADPDGAGRLSTVRKRGDRRNRPAAFRAAPGSADLGQRGQRRLCDPAQSERSAGHHHGSAERRFPGPARRTRTAPSSSAASARSRPRRVSSPRSRPWSTASCWRAPARRRWIWSIWTMSRCCRGRRALSSARTPRPAWSTSRPRSRAIPSRASPTPAITAATNTGSIPACPARSSRASSTDC